MSPLNFSLHKQQTATGRHSNSTKRSTKMFRRTLQSVSIKPVWHPNM